MAGVAKIGSIWVGTCICSNENHDDPIDTVGTIISGSGNVLADGVGQGRIGDLILAECGHIGIIVSGSANVTANGIGKGSVGSVTSGCLKGVIATGSSTTNVN